VSWSTPDTRSIWSAGMRRSPDAVPRLIEALAAAPPSQERRQYALAWALGRCGDPAAIRPLRSLLSTTGKQTVRRIATEAIRLLTPDEELDHFRRPYLQALPRNLTQHLDSPAAFSRALQAFVKPARRGRGSMDLSILHSLYLIDSDTTRHALVTLLKDAPLKAGWFRPIRYTFKAAEYRGDAEVFGLIARRFEDSLATGDAAGPLIRRAWSIGTRIYLRRRIWRHLSRLGQAGSSDYVTMASGLLLAFDDQILNSMPRTDDVAEANQPIAIRHNLDRYTVADDAYALSHVLFGQRLSPGKPGTTGWRKVVRAARQDWQENRARSESYSALWDAHPAAALSLLQSSTSQNIHSFAARILFDHPSFCANIPERNALALLSSPYLDTVTVGFSRIQLGEKVSEVLLDAAFVRLADLVSSPHAFHRDTALGLIAARPEGLLARRDQLIALLLSKHPEVFARVSRLLSDTSLPESEQARILTALLSALLSDPPDAERSAALSDLIAHALPAALPGLDLSHIHRLLASHIEPLEALGARLLVERGGEGRLPFATVRALLDTGSVYARGVGLGRIAAMSDDDLLTHQRALIGLTTHSQPDVRAASRPLIRRMLTRPELADALAEELLNLLPDQTDEAIAASLETLITRDLEPVIRGLLQKSPAAIRARLPVLLQGLSAPICRVGIWLLSLQPDDVLLGEVGLLLSLCINDRAALRVHVRPLLARLAENHPAFASDFVDKLLARTTAPEFGGSPYNLHFDPPTDGRVELSAYRLTRRRQSWPDNDGGLLQSGRAIVHTLIGAGRDDQTTRKQNLGFTFRLGGKRFTHFEADTNGWMRFAGKWSGSYNNARAFDANSGVALFPWWADLKTAVDGYVRTWITGQSGSMLRVVEWRIWPYYQMKSSENITLTFQVCLHEGSNRIEYRYGPRGVTGSPPTARRAACGIKLATSAKIDGNVRDFFGLHGTPPGSRGTFRTDLRCEGPQVHYPGGVNCGLLSTGSAGADDMEARFSDIAETLLIAFRQVLHDLSMARIRNLLSHPLAAIQALGARILLDHTTPVADLPLDLITALIDSEHDTVRAAGVALFSARPLQPLLSQPDTVFALLTHRHANVRSESVSLLSALIAMDPAFGAGLLTPLLDHADSHPVHAPEIALSIGAILAPVPDAALVGRIDLILRGVCHSGLDIRQHLYPIARRLCGADLGFCLTFSDAVLTAVAGRTERDLSRFAVGLIDVLGQLLAATPDADLADEDLVYGLASHAHPGLARVTGPLVRRLSVSLPGTAIAVAIRLLAGFGLPDDSPAPGLVHFQAIFATVPDAIHLDHPELIVQTLRHGRQSLFLDAWQKMKDLTTAHPDCGRTFAEALISLLLWREKFDGAHEMLAEIIHDDLAPWLSRISPALTWRLLKARTVAAQELGAELLGRNFTATDISLKKIGELSDHDLRTVRERAWAYYQQSIERLSADIGSGLRILDSNWLDSREFAFTFFADTFGPDVLTAAVLVTITDSVRPDVQAFGRGLITRDFGDEDGPEYLLKLSEHPDPSVELFVTNYLDRYAADQPERLALLVPWFKRVLSRVNAGRPAKVRVLRFLGEQMTTSRQAAEIVAELLIWLSAAEQIGDRATAIEMMLDLSEHCPDLSLPISVHQAELRAPHAV
jgi:hypothetical protein